MSAPMDVDYPEGPNNSGSDSDSEDSEMFLERQMQRFEKLFEDLFKRIGEVNTKLDGLLNDVEGLQNKAVGENVRKQLNHLRDKATDLDATLEYLKVNYKDSDKIAKHLFDASTEEALECLKELSRSNIFSDRDSDLIRNLLVEANLFMREQHVYSGGYEAPKAGTNNSLLNLSYKLKLYECSTDVSPLNKILAKKTNMRRTLGNIIDMHTRNVIPFVHEAAAELNFDNLLDLAMELVNLETSNNIGLNPNQSIRIDGNDSINPDGVVTIGDKAVFVFEVKRIPLLLGELVNNPNEIKINQGEIEGCLRQLVNYMLLMGYRYGILTDSETALFLEFDLEKIWKNIDPKENVPDRNCQSKYTGLISRL